MHYHRWHRTGEVGGAEPVRVDGPSAERWKSLYRVDDSGCWIWTGSLDKHGYGQYDVQSVGKRKNWRAHRWVYTQLVGPISDIETLDHLCRVHACVNPAHLDPVPHEENVRRGNAGLHNRAKTECPKGHPYDEENTRVTARGRECIICSRETHKLMAREKRGHQGNVDNADKTHCKHGHEFTPENTIRNKQGNRQCRECGRKAIREYMRRKRAAEKSG
jgi:hypothetical protein